MEVVTWLHILYNVVGHRLMAWDNLVLLCVSVIFKLAAIGKIEVAFRFACHLLATAYLKRQVGRFCWAAISAHARWLD